LGEILKVATPLTKEKLNTILAELRSRLEKLYGPRLVNLVLYGSQARGDADPGSDIDVLVVLEGPVNPGEEIERTGDIVAGLSLTYDEVISCVSVSTERFEHEQSPLLINVRREGITNWPSLQPITRPSPERDIKEIREAYTAPSEVNGDSSPSKRSSKMTSGQLALLKKASDSLKAAKLLAEQEYYDFAVSRAYYTMFYIASAFLLGEGLTFSKHSTVISMFGQHFAKTGRVPVEFHRYLIKAENRRKTGDYDTGPGLTKAQATTQITHAEQFLELAERLIGPISSSTS
jgi:uncharacterized protein (UPF0332 family)/predicted nucleotidyltransferase